MRHALVFGGSGQIGVPLLARLHEAGWRVTAVSRAPRNDAPGLHWLQGDLARVDGLPAAVDAVFSCGPLDNFAQWYAASRIDARRVLAFGSTSIDVKRGSSDAGERDGCRCAVRHVAGDTIDIRAVCRRQHEARSFTPTIFR